MSREWQPGDIGVTGAKHAGETPERFLVCKDGWTRLVFRYSDGDVTLHPPRDDARLLVAFDPEDREQVERLEALYLRDTHDACENTADCMADALREFAAPKPPCATCLDKALDGFTCNTCGNGAES